MVVTVTAKVRLFPSEEQARVLSDTVRAYVSACNFVSDYVFQTHDLGQASLNRSLYYKLREQFGLKAQMAQSVLKSVIAAYRTVLTNQKEWIRPVFKKEYCDLVWNRDYSLKPDVFSVNTLEGRVPLFYANHGMKQYFDGTWQFGTAKLRMKHGKWYLHISVSKDLPELQDTDVCNVAGVDLGVNFLAVSYDSSGKSRFFSGREVKHKRAKYKAVRKELQERKTASARRRLKAIGQRENRWMSDVNHQVSKALVASAPAGTLFVLEDLTGVRQATEKVNLEHRYEIVSWAFYDLRQKIEYKARLNGSKVITVSPKYTSQTCPKCGHTEKGNRNKKLHAFVCKNCGYRSNDDRIGAMNLYRKGIEYLSTVAQE